MEIIVARTAGFCFGVKRAVEMVYDNVTKDNVYTYGPIIHNEEVVKDLEQKGVRVFETDEEVSNSDKGTVIIRAHGVPVESYNLLSDAGHEIVDATCPFVLKIHKIVKEASLRGEYVIIVGDDSHPEVVGIRSCAGDDCKVIAGVEDAQKFVEDNKKLTKKLCIVSQTTFNYNKFQEVVEIFRKNSYQRYDILNTICNATEERQREAAEIAGRVDVMIVIGGRNSSNTQKLYDICKAICDKT